MSQILHWQRTRGFKFEGRKLEAEIGLLKHVVGLKESVRQANPPPECQPTSFVTLILTPGQVLVDSSAQVRAGGHVMEVGETCPC